jgi:membrane-associated protease RseP (regulator of RpoE activity)
VAEPLPEGAAPLPEVETGFRASVRRVVPFVLFFLTCITTLMAGSYQEGGNPIQNPADLVWGIPFAFTLMLILFVHEMGHYLTSKKYGVETSLPYFIPGPWFPYGIGTFGAFIRMRSPIMKKQALLDIGAAGPFAGFVIAIIAVGIGVSSSEIIPVEAAGSLQLSYPLMFSWIVALMGKVPADGFILDFTSVAFAGWIGLFVTSLNLLPIGQLDGGHIAYALLGKKQRFLSIGMIVFLFILGTQGWKGWYLWAVMATFLGIYHPPTLDEDVPLDLKHRLFGLASLLLFIVTFMPVPIRVSF